MLFENDYDIYDLVWLLFSFIFFTVLQLAIHEAGHALFGKLTGYKMVSFRMLSFVWSWQPDGRIIYKQQVVAGISGQCLMAPPDYNESKWPFRWYLLGWCLVNFVVSALALIIFEPTWYLFVFSFMGFVLALFNGIPDGHNDGKIYCWLLGERNIAIYYI